MQNIRIKYEFLFDDNENLDMEEETQEGSKIKSLEDSWGLYSVLDSISNDLFERLKWRQQPIEELYTYLVYLKQKSIYLKNTQS